MLLLQLPPELQVLVAGYLTTRDLVRLLRVHPSLHNDVLILEIHKQDVRATGGLAIFHYVKDKSKRGVLAMLAAGVDVSLRNALDLTALDEAVIRGDISMTRLLLQESAPDLASKAFRESQRLPPTRREHSTIMELLLRHGADPNDKNGCVEPLSRAVQSRNTAKVALLLTYGAEPGTHAYLLHIAARQNAPPSIVRMLTVELSLDIEGKDSSGRSPLQVAVRRRSTGVVEELLKLGADANSNLSNNYHPNCDAPLLIAMHGPASKPGIDTKIVRLLLEHGADANVKTESVFPFGGVTPLYQAIDRNSMDEAQTLLDHGANINLRFGIGTRVLHHAVQCGHLKMIRFLLEHGADVDCSDNGLESPIHSAIRYHSAQESVDIVQMLLEFGASVTCKDRSGITPLYIASHFCKVAVMRLLIERGADANVKTKSGLTPLYPAVDRTSIDEAQILLDHGANINHGREVLHHAVQCGHAKMIRFLLERGADVDCRDKNLESPIYRAILYHSARQSFHIVQRLLEFGANMTYKNRSGLTPLCVAARFCKVAVMRLLIERGAAIHSRCENGRTPLHWAADSPRCFSDSNKAYRAVDLLVERGADPNLKDRHGRTPMHMATAAWSAAPSPKLLELLVRSGGELDATDFKGKTPKDMLDFKHSTARQAKTICQFFEDNGA